jgi:hypothetical protein
MGEIATVVLGVDIGCVRIAIGAELPPLVWFGSLGLLLKRHILGLRAYSPLLT